MPADAFRLEACFRDRRELSLRSLCDRLDDERSLSRLADWFAAFFERVLRGRLEWEFDEESPTGGFPGDALLVDEYDVLLWHIGPTEGVLQSLFDLPASLELPFPPPREPEPERMHEEELLRVLLASDSHVEQICWRWIYADPAPPDVHESAYESLRDNFPEWDFSDVI